MKYFLGIILFISFSVSAENQQDKGIGYPSPFAAYKSLQKNPSAKFKVQQGWTLVTVDSAEGPELWSFTPESHEAHPAAIRRTVLEKNGSIYIRMRASCGASKVVCDKLLGEFRQLNANIERDLKNRK